MQQISVPRTSSNDDSCVLLEWVFKNGQEVQPDDILAYLETSKATVDLVSPGAGIFHQAAEPEGEYKTGSCIGYLFATAQEYQAFLHTGDERETKEESPALILTQDAHALVAEQGVTEAQLRSLGKTLLRKDDILVMLHPPLLGDQIPQKPRTSRNQDAIAKKVTLAHQTIPSAFAAIKIYCDEVLKAIEAYIEREGVMIGLAEVFVKVLGEIHQEYTTFYQGVEPEGRNNSSSRKSPGIGVTMDIGQGLYIPVVKDAATKSLREIADDLMTFRLKALRKTFSEEELSGGHLTLSLHTDTDIIAANPIIYPAQSCIVSLCSVQEEVYLAVNDRVKVRRYCTAGVTYDHRLNNGADAVQFLQEIKCKVETNPC